jgi:hypothetical protein
MNQELALALIPVVAPLIVALCKKFLPSLPTWALPVIATLFGPLADYLSTYVTGATANPVLALALGAAGVGLREIADQAKKALPTN